MLVETSFITTLDAPEAMAIAAAALNELTFQEVAMQGAPPPGDVSQEFLRPAQRRGYTADAWPQRVLIAFDRGRVAIATSATPPARRSFQLVNRRQRGAPPGVLQQRLLLTASSIERVLTGEPMESVLANWNTLAAQSRVADARARRRRLIKLVVVLIFFFSVVGLVVVEIVRAK